MRIEDLIFFYSDRYTRPWVTVYGTSTQPSTRSYIMQNQKVVDAAATARSLSLSLSQEAHSTPRPRLSPQRPGRVILSRQCRATRPGGLVRRRRRLSPPTARRPGESENAWFERRVVADRQARSAATSREHRTTARPSTQCPGRVAAAEHGAEGAAKTVPSQSIPTPRPRCLPAIPKETLLAARRQSQTRRALRTQTLPASAESTASSSTAHSPAKIKNSRIVRVPIGEPPRHDHAEPLQPLSTANAAAAVVTSKLLCTARDTRCVSMNPVVVMPQMKNAIVSAM